MPTNGMKNVKVGMAHERLDFDPHNREGVALCKPADSNRHEFVHT